jgi:serine/threonine protein phosphatase PrpC
MANVVSQNPPQRACVRLVETAKSRGGFDNITLAVIPLGGQLRQEPPAGFEDSVKKRRQKQAAAAEQNSKRDLVRILVLVLLLSGLSALVTMLMMAFSLSH